MRSKRDGVYLFKKPLVEIFLSSSGCPIRDICGSKAKVYRIERRIVKTTTFPVESRASFRVVASSTARRWPRRSKSSGSDGSCGHSNGCSLRRLDENVRRSPGDDSGRDTLGTNRRSLGRSSSVVVDSRQPERSIAVAGMAFADDISILLRSRGADSGGGANAASESVVARDGDVGNADDVNAGAAGASDADHGGDFAVVADDSLQGSSTGY